MTQQIRLKYVQTETSRHGTTKNYFRRNRRERVRLPDDPNSDEFRAAYAKALASEPVPDVRDIKPTAVELRKQRTERTLKSALVAARRRAKAKGVPFNLDVDFLLDLVELQEFRCALTGIEFFAQIDNAASIDPCTPSIDRIEPQKGYVKSNVRVIIYAMNAMLLDWGEDVFIQIANSYRYTKRTKEQHSNPAPRSALPHPK